MGASLPTRLLGVWAHPDDECYLSAGLMARVVEAGGDVRIVCATRGEHGTDDAALAGTTAFGATREAELVASLAVLGVHDVRFLGLLDGSCSLADDDRMAAAVADQIGSFLPDTVVTFGPDGITGHPDHRAVCRWTTRAAAIAPAGELLYATMADHHVARHHELHESLGIFDELEGGPRSVPRDELALVCSLDDRELQRKRRALAAHGSQTEGLAAAMGEHTYRTWWRDECFRAPTAAERAVVADDPMSGARA